MVAGYIFAVLMPLIGFIIGLTQINRSRYGIWVVVISLGGLLRLAGAHCWEHFDLLRRHVLMGGGTMRINLIGVAFLTLLVWWTVGCGGDGGETTVIREQPAETQPANTTTVTEQAGGGGGGAPAPAPAAQPEPTGEAPDVVGQRLDIAKDDLRAAGYRPRVSGGGILGVVVDQNWVVCDQQPPDGDAVDVNVDRSC